MNQRTICFFNSNKAWGGGEKWHLETALHVKNKGYNVVVYAFGNKELYARAFRSGLKATSVKISSLSFLNPFKIFSLASEFKSKRIDCIILNLSADVKTAGIAARLAGVEKIIYRRGLAVPVKNSFLNRFLFRKILTTFISNSIDIENKILVNHPYLRGSGKMKIIHNGVDVSLFPEKAAKKANDHKKIIIGNVGRLVAQKAQHYLVDLAVKLKENNIFAEIHIAGSGELEQELKTNVKDRDVEGFIKFRGFLSNLDDFYHEIDIFILTSLHEGSSNAVIEAMAWGKPMLAFNISSMPEMIVDQVNGFLVEVGDIDSLYEKLILMVQNNGFLNKMGNESIRLVRERFNKEKNLEKLIDLINLNR